MVSFLLRYPEKTKTLIDEVRGALTNRFQIDVEGTLPVEYPLAVVEKILRILPPVPFLVFLARALEHSSAVMWLQKGPLFLSLHIQHLTM